MENWIGKTITEFTASGETWSGFYPVVQNGVIIAIDDAQNSEYPDNPIIDDYYIDVDVMEGREGE